MNKKCQIKYNQIHLCQLRLQKKVPILFKQILNYKFDHKGVSINSSD